VVIVVPVGEEGAEAKTSSASESVAEGGTVGRMLSAVTSAGGATTAVATSQLGGGDRSRSGGRAGGASGTESRNVAPDGVKEGGCRTVEGLGYGNGGGASSASGTSV
jgi:hypothetical protein